MSFPAVLYKYREWKNPWHKNILLTNSIYAPSPNEFEDEYDCNLDYVIPTTEEIRQKIMSKGYSCEDALEYAKKSPLNHQESIKDIKRYWHNELGVVSLTGDPCNYEMWCRYGDSNKGFCVAFDVSKLLPFFNIARKVEYGDLPKVDIINDDIDTQIGKEYFHKSKEYEYEEEYRFIKRWEVIPEDKNLKLSPDTIVGVKLGAEMPDEDKEEIRTILREKNILEIVDNY